MRRVFFVSIFIILLLPLSTNAQEEAGRDPIFEQEVYDRLGAIDRDAIPIFVEATIAMDAGDYETAREGYNEVLALIPDSDDAMRRLSYVETALGNHEEAISLTREAYALSNSPTNQAGLARALLNSENPDYFSEALSLAQSAANARPTDEWIQNALLYAGVVNENTAAIRQASEALIEFYPEESAYYYYLGFSAAQQEDWLIAENALLRARKLGFEPSEIDRLLGLGISREAWRVRLTNMAIYGFITWVSGMLILLALGWILSRLTLATTNRAIKTGEFNASPTENLIRQVYRLVITVSSVYFYISLPIVGLLVIAAILGIFYMFFWIGRIPIRLVLILGVFGLVTVGAVFRGMLAMFKRPQWQAPGEPLQPDDAPAMWELVREVAIKVNTRAVDNIYIVPGASIAVMEHGNILSKMMDRSQRYLILGLGAMQEMTIPQLQAILAHEYGHFSNRDTAGGDLAMQVRNAMMETAHHLAINGQANALNPMWLFLNLFNRIFLRITHGASRLQEVMADRFAVVAYGANNFIDGLTHVIRQSIKQDMQLNSEFQNIISGNETTSNIYQLPELDGDNITQFDKSFEEVMNRPTGTYDTHPSFQDRIALAQHIQTDTIEDAPPTPVVDLLPNLELLQDKMTKLINNAMKQRKQQIARIQQQQNRQATT